MPRELQERGTPQRRHPPKLLATRPQRGLPIAPKPPPDGAHQLLLRRPSPTHTQNQHHTKHAPHSTPTTRATPTAGSSPYQVGERRLPPCRQDTPAPAHPPEGEHITKGKNPHKIKHHCGLKGGGGGGVGWCAAERVAAGRRVAGRERGCASPQGTRWAALFTFGAVQTT